MEANKAAITEGDEWLDQLLPYIDGNHDLAEVLSQEERPHEWSYTKAQGTYLAWLDVSELMDKVGAREKAEHEENKTSESTVTPEQIMQRWFAENARIYLNPGHSYGTGGSRTHAHEPGDLARAGAEGAGQPRRGGGEGVGRKAEVGGAAGVTRLPEKRRVRNARPAALSCSG